MLDFYKSPDVGIYLSGLLEDTDIPGYENDWDLNDNVRELIYYAKQLDLGTEYHPLDVYSTQISPEELAKDLREILERVPEFREEIKKNK